MRIFSYRTLVGAAFVSLLIILSARSLQKSKQRFFPVHDEVTYLDLARGVANAGLLDSIGDYYTGKNVEDKRSPFYVLLLSTFMERTPQDFTRAKLFSLVQCLLLVCIVHFFCWRRWGPLVAWGMSVTLCISPILTLFSQQVLADIFFSAFYFCCLILVSSDQKSWRTWALAGIFAGLTYLTKANGHFVWIGMAAAGIYDLGWRFFKRPAFVAALGFAATASFLLVRNTIVWGTPFYNINNKVIWLDHWSQYWVLPTLPVWEEVGLRWYLQHHTFAQMAARFINGGQNILTGLIDCFSIGPAHPLAMFMTGCVALGLSLYGMTLQWKKGARREVLCVASVGLVLLAAFAWGEAPMGINHRYIFPIALTWMPFAWLAIGSLSGGYLTSIPKHIGVTLASLAVAGAAVGVTLSKKAVFSNPIEFWSIPPFWGQASEWITENTNDKPVLVSYFSVFSRWHCCRDTNEPFGYELPDHEIKAHIQRKNVHFAMVDQTVIDKDPSQQKYGPRDEHGPTTFLGWPRCFNDSFTPSVFLIYGEACPPAPAPTR